MAKYVAKRLVTGAAALLFLTFLTFVMAHKMPGNPFDTGNVSEQVLQTIEEEYGLGEPLQVQFAFYMKNLLRGDLGMSIKKPGVTVNSVIARSLPVTAKVGILDSWNSLRNLAPDDQKKACKKSDFVYRECRDWCAKLCICLIIHAHLWCIFEMVSNCRDHDANELCIAGGRTCRVSNMCDFADVLQRSAKRIYTGICYVFEGKRTERISNPDEAYVAAGSYTVVDLSWTIAGVSCDGLFCGREYLHYSRSWKRIRYVYQ